MKILLIAGHGAGDSGALGNGYREADCTRETVKLLKEELLKYEDVAVNTYDTSRNAFYDAQNGEFNIGKYDYVIEMHFNASDNSSAHGTECFVTHEENGIDVEKRIMKNLSKFYTLRDNDNVFDGVKRTNFLVITQVKNKGMSGVLIELCFITNENDMKIYSANKKELAKLIADGVASGFKLEKKVEKVKNTNIAVVKYMAEDKNEYYLNVYKTDKLEKTDYTGYYNSILTIGTEGARNCYSKWDKNKKVASGKSKGQKPKGTKILVKKVATV